MVRFAPLIPCDRCGALVEPHARRCGYCRQRHGNPAPAIDMDKLARGMGGRAARKGGRRP